ncbi:MAG: cytochrome c [Gemmatimonadetes bacterium]|nr:cytochrome c [Gemmatimonadota bacterium]
MNGEPMDSGGSGGGRRRWGGVLGHPFWQSALVLVASYLLFTVGVAVIPPLLGIASAPVPRSVVWQYVLTMLVGVLLYVSADEQRWTRFKEPVNALLTDPGRRTQRILVLTAIPLLVGVLAYRSVSASVGAPMSLRSVHPAPPAQITFRGSDIRLDGLENPFRKEGSMEDHLAVGASVYVRNCMPCHGDRLDGDGHYAHAFNPLPADFTSNGTIAQLTESYVFWRIAKGGPGLPKEGTPWNSAMPAWEDILTQDEIWAVILYLYDQTGRSPRTWEEVSGEGEH